MATEYQGLYITFGANTAEFDNSVKGINAALRTLRQNVTNLNRELKFDPGNVDVLNEKLKNFRQQLDLNEKQLQNFRSDLSKLPKEDIGGPKWAKLTTQIEATESKIKILNGAIATTEKRIKDAGDPHSILNLDHALDEVKTDLDLVNQRLAQTPKDEALATRQMQLLEQASSLTAQKVATLKAEQDKLPRSDIGGRNWTQLQRQIDQAEISAGKMRGALTQVSKATTPMATRIKAASSAMSSFVGNIGANIVARGFSTISSSIGSAVKRIDTLKAFPKILQSMGIGAKDAQKAITNLDKGTRGLPITLDDVANSALQLIPVTKDTKAAVKTTLALTDALSASRKPMEVQNSAMQQYVQMLGKGKFEAQDFKSLQQAMPGPLSQVAKALGIASGNTAILREKMSSGAISVADFNRAFVALDSKGIKGFESFHDQALAATDGIETGFKNLQAAVVRNMAKIITTLIGDTDIKGSFDKAKASIDAAGDSLAKIVKDVKDNKDWLIPLAGTLAGIFASLKAILAVKKGYKEIKGLIDSAKALAAVSGGSSVTGAFASMFSSAAVAAPALGTVAASLAAIWGTWQAIQTDIGDQTIGEKLFESQQKYNESTIEQTNAVRDAVKSAYQNMGESSATYSQVMTDSTKSQTDQIKGFFSGMWTSISTGAANLWNNQVIPIFSTAVGALRAIIARIGGFFSGIWGQVKGALKVVADGIKGVFNGIVEWVKQIPGRIADAFRGLWGKIQDAAGAAWRFISGQPVNVNVQASPQSMTQAMRMPTSVGPALPRLFRTDRSQTTTNSNTFNIRISAPSNDATAIAREVERIIVRRAYL